MSVITVTSENFETEVLQAEKPVLVDFWAAWCGPCRRLSPLVDQIAEEAPDIKVGKVNVDEQPALRDQFGIMSIPTLLVFKEGEQTASLVGIPASNPKQAILDMVSQN